MVRSPLHPLLLVAVLSVASTASAQPSEGPTGTTVPAQGSMDRSDSFHHHHWGFSPYRSPGLAFVLSLTPVPIDFGNLYAENTGWGIAYTSVELGLGGSMLWMGMGHMCHSEECDSWSDNQRLTMLGLVSGYVAVKLGAGIHATYAAEEFNARQRAAAFPVISPTTGGALVGWQLRF